MKKKSNFIIIFLVAVFVLIGSLVWADSNGVWHRAEDVRGGIFGADEGVVGDYIFNNPVKINNDLTVNAVNVGVIKSNESNGNVVIQLG